MNATPHAYEASADLSITELAHLSGLSEAELRDLAGYGAIAPRNAAPDTAQWTFASHTTLTLRTVSRLRDDLDLDLYAVSVCLRYLDRIDGLERRIRLLQAQMPGPPGG
jgi:chaperone modulatory protein CbpM